MKLFMFIALTASMASAQTTRHVDVHGTAPGTGTALDPYTSIQYALDAPTTTALDTVLVHSGVYHEHVVMNQPRQLVSADGPLSTIITVGGGGPAFRSSYPGSRLEGFTLMKSAGDSFSRVVFMEGLYLTRCIVVGTPAISGVFFGEGTIDHCLVTGCLKPIFFGAHSFGEFRNSIFWGNAQPFGVDSNQSSITIEIEYCLVDFILGNGPTTSITGPPLLKNITAHDFHLRSTSPCIDAGDPAAPHDPDGSRSDIGPLPYDPSYVPFSTYCTAKVNSLGCVPAVDATGNASATSPESFDIQCVNELNHRQGLLAWGYAASSTPYQGGYFCVQSPVRRSPVLDSGGNVGGDDCSGVYTFDFNALIRSGTDPRLEPGAHVFAQFWSRDSASSFTTNRSDAIEFVIAP